MLLLGASAPSFAASMDDLLRAYPDALAGFDGANLIWRDGTRMPVADGRPDKDMAEQLRNGSILDQLRLPYPAGAPVLPPQQDPGRVRNRAFFDKMYGDCRSGQVAPKLVPVVWLPNTWGHVVRITSVNGVDHALAAVSRELDALPAQDKKIPLPAGRDLCLPVGRRHRRRPACMPGARRSISTPPTPTTGYGAGDAPYVDRIPTEIVAVFERHGFIWGGRWAHYDTMHFEYRPELLGQRPTSE